MRAAQSWTPSVGGGVVGNFAFHVGMCTVAGIFSRAIQQLQGTCHWCSSAAPMYGRRGQHCLSERASEEFAWFRGARRALFARDGHSDRS